MNSSVIVIFALLAASNASVHGGAELYSGIYGNGFPGHTGLLGHSGLLGHAGLVGVGRLVAPGVAYSAPGLAHTTYSAPTVLTETAVAPSAIFVQGVDTDAVVAGPSGTVSRAGGVVANSVAAPAAVYSAHSPAVYAYGSPAVASSYLRNSGVSSGVIATDHVGDSIVAGPSGTITTNAGAAGHYGVHSPSVYTNGAGVLAGSYLARSGITSGVVASDHLGDSVVAGPSGTITTNVGAAGSYGVHSQALYAQGAGVLSGSYLAKSGLASGFIASDHLGDSLVAGPSGTIKTDAVVGGSHVAPVAHYAAPFARAYHGW